MVAPANRRTAPGEKSRGRDEARIEDWDEQNQYRTRDDGKHAGGALAIARMRDRQDSEIEPDEEAPAVAHEDSCRMHVVDEKSGGRSEQNGEVFGLGCHPDGHDERRQQRRTRDEADARAQPVHVVEQVEGIGQPDDPEDRQQRVERQGFDPCQPVTKEDEHGRESDLRHELRVRLQRDQVVRDADDEHSGAADEEPEQLTRIDQQRAEHEHREGNRNAAKQRCRVGVPAILAGFGDVTQPDSQEAAQRDEQNRERETRDGAREELGRHLRSTERHAWLRHIAEDSRAPPALQERSLERSATRSRLFHSMYNSPA